MRRSSPVVAPARATAHNPKRTTRDPCSLTTPSVLEELSSSQRIAPRRRRESAVPIATSAEANATKDLESDPVRGREPRPAASVDACARTRAGVGAGAGGPLETSTPGECTTDGGGGVVPGSSSSSGGGSALGTQLRSWND